MSLLKSIGKVLTGVGKKILAPVVGGIIGGPAGAAASIALSAAGSKLATKGIATMSAKLPALPVLPGGAVLGAAATAVTAGGVIWDQVSQPRKRRRRKGITAKDLTSFKRVARLVDKYAKPVHHFRNIKK